MRPILLMLMAVIALLVPAKMLVQNDKVSDLQSSLNKETVSARNDTLLNTQIVGESGASNSWNTQNSLAEKKYRQDALIAAQKIKRLQ